ncbi:hypothetical protein L7F22_001778 [Adiantum nelumboides]|nr:hypothetical protein [Adiantum nelumboides]
MVSRSTTCPTYWGLGLKLHHLSNLLGLRFPDPPLVQPTGAQVEVQERLEQKPQFALHPEFVQGLGIRFKQTYMEYNGSVDRYKARFVSRGFTQQEGVDYFDTYSPVLGMTAFQVLIALAVKFNLLLYHLDIETAFLHGFLQELIYMLQPPHFEDPHHPDYVCKLNKPIYGLKQSVRELYIRMHHYLIKCGCERFMADYNVYTWQTAKGIAILGLFVNDIPFLGTSEYMLLQAIDCISRDFSVTDKGSMTYFLGIEVIQDPAGKFIQLSQSKYIQELFLFYGMSASSPELTPLSVKHKFAPEFHAYTRTDVLYCPSFYFTKFCGQLRYFISCTRFDLCYTGHILSRSMSKPCKVHKQAAKRTFRYLRTTLHYALTYYYDPSSPISISGYVDANWTGDDTGCFSTGGYAFTLAGGSIS